MGTPYSISRYNLSCKCFVSLIYSISNNSSFSVWVVRLVYQSSVIFPLRFGLFSHCVWLSLIITSINLIIQSDNNLMRTRNRRNELLPHIPILISHLITLTCNASIQVRIVHWDKCPWHLTCLSPMDGSCVNQQSPPNLSTVTPLSRVEDC